MRSTSIATVLFWADVGVLGVLEGPVPHGVDEPDWDGEGDGMCPDDPIKMSCDERGTTSPRSSVRLLPHNRELILLGSTGAG